MVTNSPLPANYLPAERPLMGPGAAQQFGGEPVSLLSDSPSSGRSETVDLSSTPPSSLSDIGDDDLRPDQKAPAVCSAVHSLERDMPDYDYSHLVARLRAAILEEAQQNPGLYSHADLEKCRHDDWFLSRFLLRQKMDLPEALEMLKRAMRFNNEAIASHMRPEDFPAEFYELGGLIPYGRDRKGNRMMYMRVRLHRKTPEVAAVIQSYIYYNIKKLDDEAQGKGERCINLRGGHNDCLGIVTHAGSCNLWRPP